MTTYEPKVGDRVSWSQHLSFGRETRWGQVVRVTASTATVKPDHRKERLFRRSKVGGFGLTRETDEQRARREWMERVPRGQHVTAVLSWRGDKFEAIATNRVANADDCRAAARELDAFATWLDAEPESARRSR